MYNVVKIDKTKGKVATDVNLATLRDGSNLFAANTNVTNWTADMPNLVNAQGMFHASSITSFNGNLKNVKGARDMFCLTKLSNFSADLSLLSEGITMFLGCSLKSWNTKLPNLSSAIHMFQYNPLSIFDEDLPKLSSAGALFYGCGKLTKFRGTLPSLSSGDSMFYGCKLDARSVLCIISSVPTWASGSHPLTIGCGCSADEESKNAYAQEIGYESFTALNDAFIAKGWTVTWQFNGPAAANYSLRNPRPEPKKVFAKINEIDEDVASYTDGEKFYNLDWGHVVNDDSYEEFESFEAALEHFNLRELNRNQGDE